MNPPNKERSICFTIQNLDLIYGSKPKKAFTALDANQTKSEIQKTLGNIIAFHNISLEIRRGEILVLMGLSGSGKSSLLRCLNGLNGRGNGFSRGKVLYHTPECSTPMDILTCPKRVLRNIRRHHISMVFQQFVLLPWKNVLENVAFPLRLQGFPKKSRLKRRELGYKP